MIDEFYLIVLPFTKLYRKIEFFYTGVIKTEANLKTLLETSFTCNECPIFKECN